MPPPRRAPHAGPQLDEPIPEACGIADVDVNLTCLGLLRELKKDREKQATLIEDAERRERWVLGESWMPRDPLIETIHAEAAMPDVVVTENLLYPLTLTYTSRVNQGKIDPTALPVHPTPANVAQADATNAAIEYMRREHDEDELCTDGTQLAQYHGDVLFLPRFDETAGPNLCRVPVPAMIADPATGQPMPALDGEGEPLPQVDPQTGEIVTELKWEYGDVVESLVAAPDYWTDLVSDYSDASYLAVRWVVSKHEARAAMLAAGYSGDNIAGGNHHYANPADLDVRGVECHEVWAKPGTRFANGGHFMFVGEVTCVAEVWSLPFNDLPGAVFKLGKVRGSPRGKTHVADAVHQQKLLNQALRAIQARLVLAGTCVITGPDNIVSQIPRGGIKRVPTINPTQTPVFTTGNDVPQGMWSAYQAARTAIYDVFGVSDTSATGGDPTDTKSGKQMTIAMQSDAQKWTPAREALQRARKQVAIHKVELARTGWSNERLVAVIGPQGVYESRWLKGADIGGMDVVIETASGLLNSRLAGQRTAEERGQAGLISPQDASEESRTGLDNTVGASQNMERVDAQALAALQGRPQQPLPDVEPQAAAQRLRQLLASPLGKQGNSQMLSRLAQQYEQAYRLGQQGQAQGGQAPPQQGQQGGPQPTRQGAGVKATKITAERASSGNGGPANGAQ